MIEQKQGLFFAVAGAAQVGRRADAAEIAAAEHDPVDVALRQQMAASSRTAGPRWSAYLNRVRQGLRKQDPSSASQGPRSTHADILMAGIPIAGCS
jgi:hypothetical protein